ncbi:histidine phosphatase family protein [Sphingomonas sp.]|uniref:histidine phosphatase family protein n=1 Tax=Sphingomonas sp. TaxID=28214 RepID=UPI0025E45F47|nr:histidine phosphatase family protein [Sphingomonas sp.]
MKPAGNLLKGKTWIARHGETVFNAGRRLQGEITHTPLTRAGFAHAEAMGMALRAQLGAAPALTLWSSPAGRALQTLAIIAEHLDLDWHGAHIDDRLMEIGMGSWGGRYYADVVAEAGPVIDPMTMLLKPAPDGETYGRIAARVGAWAGDAASDPGDRLVVMHGISSRVLRGVLTGLPIDPAYGAPIATGLPQGSVAVIADGVEQIAILGTGGGHA